MNKSLKEFLQPYEDAQLITLMMEIADICKKIAKHVTLGGLSDLANKLEVTNVQGETQTKLDALSNDLFISGLNSTGLVAGFASEELEEVVVLASGEKAPFLVLFDPLDGSSNVALNVTIGSIFSVLKAPSGKVKEEDFLQPGQRQLAAGYALYGASTMLVITLGKGTHGFTLNPDSQDFVLTHPNMQVAESTSEFAINASNERFWEPPIQRYVDECRAGQTGPRGRDFNMRWVGSMVAEVHRILLRGGIYLYPRDSKKPLKAGRLRLMYELNPMSMLVEQAGGKGSTGDMRVMELVPDNVHQRAPIVLGTAQEVSLVERYTQAFAAGDTQRSYAQLFGERSLFHKKQ